MKKNILHIIFYFCFAFLFIKSTAPFIPHFPGFSIEKTLTDWNGDMEENNTQIPEEGNKPETEKEELTDKLPEGFDITIRYSYVKAGPFPGFLHFPKVCREIPVPPPEISSLS